MTSSRSALCTTTVVVIVILKLNFLVYLLQIKYGSPVTKDVAIWSSGGALVSSLDQRSYSNSLFTLTDCSRRRQSLTYKKDVRTFVAYLKMLLTCVADLEKRRRHITRSSHLPTLSPTWRRVSTTRWRNKKFSWSPYRRNTPSRRVLRLSPKTRFCGMIIYLEPMLLVNTAL